MDRERRTHPRKRISTAVAFNDAGGPPLRGFLRDISRGGCFIASPSVLTFGEPIEFELRLSEVHALVKGKGRVTWVRDKSARRDLPAGMGVEFVEMAEETLVAIDGLSDMRAPSLSRPNTVIGIAPAPATSSPSFAPDIDIVLDAFAEEAQEPQPAEAVPPASPESPLARPTPPTPPTRLPLSPNALPPPIDLQQAPRPRSVWLIGGGIVLLLVGGLAALAVGLLHRGSSVVASDDAAPDSLAATAAVAGTDSSETPPAIAPEVDAGVAADAQVHDAGHDGGHHHGKPVVHGKPKPKPKPRR